MRLLILVSLLGLGCAELPQNLQKVSTEDTLKAWEYAGHPPGNCRERAPHVRVVQVSDTEDLCGRPHLYGCYLGHECRGLFALGSCWDIVVLRGDQPVPALLRHELTHWLLDCSGEAPGGDYFHANMVWDDDGFGPLPFLETGPEKCDMKKGCQIPSNTLGQ